MAEGYGVKTSQKEGMGILWLVGGGLVLAYLWANSVKDKLFQAPTDWFQNIGESIGKFGDQLGDLGHTIDLTDPAKYDWLSGPSGILANTGNWLGGVGHAIDFTDDNSAAATINIFDERKYDWVDVPDFFGWANPWD